MYKTLPALLVSRAQAWAMYNRAHDAASRRDVLKRINASDATKELIEFCLEQASRRSNKPVHPQFAARDFPQDLETVFRRLNAGDVVEAWQVLALVDAETHELRERIEIAEAFTTPATAPEGSFYAVYVWR
jgi:hypothetical protein